MASSEASRQNGDFISNVPDIVTDKILELLPIRVAARTSLLSKQWRRNWLSLKNLGFDSKFCMQHLNENGKCNWKECCNIISSILFCHDGPVLDFKLYIPGAEDEACMNLGQWLSFLSKNEVRRINIDNWSKSMHISSYIFWCSELVHLELFDFTMNPPPTGFNGFTKLQNLVLLLINFSQPDIFDKLIANCHMLATLKLVSCSGIDHVVINLPSLETLTINGQLETLAFGNVRNLKNISVSLRERQGNTIVMETVDAINLLATSCQLRSVQFGGDLCKFLAADGIRRARPVVFNHLIKLSLSDLNLNDSRVLHYVFRVGESCPYVKALDISVCGGEYTNQQEIDCHNKLKMDNLLEVKIDGITGSSGELILIEYLFANSSVLETLSFKFGHLDIESELMLLRALAGFPRSSPKARLVCLNRLL